MTKLLAFLLENCSDLLCEFKIDSEDYVSASYKDLKIKRDLPFEFEPSFLFVEGGDFFNVERHIWFDISMADLPEVKYGKFYYDDLIGLRNFIIESNQ